MMNCLANSNVVLVVRAKRSSCFMNEYLIVLNSSIFSAFESLFSFKRSVDALWTASITSFHSDYILPRGSRASKAAFLAASDSSFSFYLFAASSSWAAFLFSFSSSLSSWSISCAFFESLPFVFQSNHASSSGKRGRASLCSRYLVNSMTSSFSSVTQRLLLLHRECILS